MSDTSNLPAGGGGEGQPQQVPGPVSARVPERVMRGVFSTGQLVLDGPKEFVIDFLQGLTRPFSVVARVVMTPQTMREFADALSQSLDKYSQAFGPPPQFMVPPMDRKPTLQEIYENFKLPDDQLNGAYANSVLIGFSPTEFFFDFIATFYPNPAVGARVFLPAQQAPRFLTMLGNSIRQYQQRMTGGAPPPPQT